MSSKKPRIPSYRHHKGSGQAFVQIKGKRHYLGKYGTEKSQERYNRFVAELCSNHTPRALADKSPVDRIGGITVVELIAAYLEFARHYYVKNGRSTGSTERLRPVLRLLRKTYGRTLSREFGPTKLKALREKMVSDGQSRTYVNMNVDRIRRVFKWGVGEELLPPAIHQALMAVPGLRKGRTEARETAPVTPVADDVVDATLPCLTPVTADMVRFQRLTGCRPIEVRLIRPSAVDRTTTDVWIYRPTEHKTEHHERDRVIIIGPLAQDILRPYLLREAEAYCFSPKESRQKWLKSRRTSRKTPAGQGNEPGTNRKRNPKRAPGPSYSKDAYRCAINRAAKRAGVPAWSPNQMRHTAATEIRHKYGLEAAQTVLGHSRADVTQIYAERDLDLAKRIMAEVG